MNTGTHVYKGVSDTHMNKGGHVHDGVSNTHMAIVIQVHTPHTQKCMQNMKKRNDCHEENKCLIIYF